MKKILSYITMVFAVVFVLTSCDNDPVEIGGGFLGIDVDGLIIEEEFPVRAFSTRLNPVQTNNYASPVSGPSTVLVGKYEDPIYGTSNYDFVTQLSIPTANPEFSENAELTNVILTIPYYSRSVGQDGEETLYELDSVYGGGEIKLKVFENRFFLNSFDPDNLTDAAIYYSDDDDRIENNLGDEIIEDLTFTPSNDEVQIMDEDDDGVEFVLERLSPRLRRELDTEFWEERIFNRFNTNDFSSDSNFQNFFRGLYFQLQDDSENSMMYLNLNDASVDLVVEDSFVDEDDLDGDGDTTEVIELNSTVTLSFSGNGINFIEHDFPDEIEDRIEESADGEDDEDGAEFLFLKGGPGAITFIDLFGADTDSNGEADALTEFLTRDVSINDASLEFFVAVNDFQDADDADNGGDTEPERIVIYDFVTGNFLADFEVTGAGLNANTNHLGRLERDDDDSDDIGIKYRIRLTDHIQSIVNGDRENNRLALQVSQNVSLIGRSAVRDQDEPFEIEEILSGAAISHEGTVLFGSDVDGEDRDKRLVLKIFYTDATN
ncbi:DUF4270 domain-containing protein [Nonlabens ponticola]|uniref:DUF4270 domain-containing protein n=1 Tax=Nonlabens ponticola TaxID=2496866 RepID=A0A3S9MVU5_9FLAO|nr:DUF4270 domain-containing protein [Nonlabens ponticola]AZQ43249.1 DUF4270 domain-containing protein [Nonlabens ponticola]